MYGAQYPAAGATNIYNVQLYHLDAAGTPSHQDLNTSVNGSEPKYFVQVGGTIFFTAAQATPQNYTSSAHDLWKLTACSSITPPPPAIGVAQVPAAGRATLYPNPATDGVQVALEGPAGDAILTLLDATGRMVLAVPVQGGQIVSTAQLPAGVYLWRLTAAHLPLQAGRISVAH